MARIARLIGGAGTGKTTELMTLLSQVLDHGLGLYDIGFATFTRAARREATARAAQIFGCPAEQIERDGWFRTIDSVCYRALGSRCGELLLDNAESRRWLQEALGEAVTGLGEDLGDATPQLGEKTPADIALAIWKSARNRLEPLEQVWTEARAIDERVPDWDTVYALVEKYELHKKLDGRCDFCDLRGAFAGWRFDLDEPWPCDPQGDVPPLSVWFFDEQQDASRLLDQVCRRLIETEYCRWVYVVGDPMQAIYGWAGADSRCFREWEADKERTMPKSYRCPAPILELGERVLQPCSDYFDRGIAPADHDGAVEYRWLNRELLQEIDPRESWLVIARSNYLARKLQAELIDAGIPWAYTKGKGGWLTPTEVEAFASMFTLASGQPITFPEWRRVVDVLPAKCPDGPLFVRGTKSRLDEENSRRNSDELADVQQIESWGATPLLQRSLLDGSWPELVDGARRFCDAVERWGWNVALEPQVRVGTIHSVKGAEADNVLLLTTSTYQCERAMQNQRMADEERRVAYVGVTRARYRLLIVHERGAKYRIPI